eukprot:m.47738 g.47738  ORF g.47738 m.47738 type:complete len:288 (-) comp8881_c0_seq1:6668-7531(-)
MQSDEVTGWSGRLAALRRLPPERTRWIGPLSSEQVGRDSPDTQVTDRNGASGTVQLCLEPNERFALISLFDMGGTADLVAAGRAGTLATQIRCELQRCLGEPETSVLFAASPHELDPLLHAVMGTLPCGGDGPFRCWVRRGSSADDAVPMVPDGYALVSLEAKDAEIVNDRWPYGSRGTVEMVRECITERPSAAVRHDGTLVAWAVTRNDGSVGMLHTEPAHRKRGLASAVVTSIVAQLHWRSECPFFYVEEGNKGSELIAAKLGFEPTKDSGYSWRSFKRLPHETV